VLGTSMHDVAGRLAELVRDAHREGFVNGSGREAFPSSEDEQEEWDNGDTSKKLDEFFYGDG